MIENVGINDLKGNRWTGTDPEDGLPGQIKFWREYFERNREPGWLAEFNEYVRREGLEEVTTKTEYRTLDTTDKSEIRVGDRVTISRRSLPEMGEVTGVAYTDSEMGLMVAAFLVESGYTSIHKIERPVIALPTEPGLYTVAPVGRPLGDFRVFGLSSRGVWSEGGGEALDEDHYFFLYVADGDWTLRRLVVEGK